MKKQIVVIFILLFPFAQSISQTNIYVSNNGTNTGTSLPTMNNPAKTLENALIYIKNNLVNSNNEAITPINIYLKDDGGEIMIAANSNTLLWDVSGTFVNPITIRSLGPNSRAILSRNSDHGRMIHLKNANYINIKYVEFNKVTEGGLELDNCDFNEITYCAFHGDGNFETVKSTGIIWIGVNPNNGYAGQNSLTSTNNVVSHNLFYDLKVDAETDQHHGIYLSNGAHNNKVAYNYINFAPCHGILGQHADYKDNYISANLISQKAQSSYPDKRGIYFTGFDDRVNPEVNYDNGYPNSITGNNAVGNYVYDSNNSTALAISQGLPSSNTQSNNKAYYGWYPSDPYWLGYSADRIKGRMVSGDFDGDSDDDIAALYDNGSGNANLHVWLASGESFIYGNASSGWWSENQNGYFATQATDKLVSGDFNGDGKDDIVAFYDNGNNNTSLQLWLSTGSDFTYQGGNGWWTIGGYNANKITGRVVSGDFDGNGYDDIAAFYDNGNSNTSLHMWLSSGTHITYQGANGWWTTGGYNANKITGRVISGDFDGNGFDDIAAFYDNGTNHTNLHMWLSSGSHITYQGSNGWWTTGGYNATKITGRVVSGDFDGNGFDDVAAFYDNGNSNTNIHAWLSSGTHITYQNSSGWWTENENGYNVEKITGRVVAGDFDNDGQHDISAFYDYSDTFGAIRSNVWESTGANFNYFNESLGYPWRTQFSYFPETNVSNFSARIEPIYQVEGEEMVVVYPNPSNGLIQFEFSDIPKSIRVFDVQGKLILQKAISKNKYTLDLSEKTSGIYFYNVLFETNILSGKLVIE